MRAPKAYLSTRRVLLLAESERNLAAVRLELESEKDNYKSRKAARKRAHMKQLADFEDEVCHRSKWVEVGRSK